MITLNRIENKGRGLVAVFDADYGIEQFCLNEESLLSRIVNIEAGKGHPSRDTSVERAALAELHRVKASTSINERIAERTETDQTCQGANSPS